MEHPASGRGEGDDEDGERAADHGSPWVNAGLGGVSSDPALASGRPGAGTAGTTIDVILTLLDRSIDELERCTRIAVLALRVAIEMDRAAAAPPAGQRSWAAFGRLRTRGRRLENYRGPPS